METAWKSADRIYTVHLILETQRDHCVSLVRQFQLHKHFWKLGLFDHLVEGLVIEDSGHAEGSG